MDCILRLTYDYFIAGMLATATRTILESLDRLPNADNRTKVAIIGFDTALHFFCVPVRGSEVHTRRAWADKPFLAWFN